MTELEEIVWELSNAERNALAWVCRSEDTRNAPHGMRPFLIELGLKKLIWPPSYVGDGWQPTEKGQEIFEIISRS